VAFTNEVSNEVHEQVYSILNAVVHDKVEDILTIVQNYSKSKEILEGIGLTNQTKNRNRYLDPLIKVGWIGMLNPEVKRDPTQIKAAAAGDTQVQVDFEAEVMEGIGYRNRPIFIFLM